MAQCLAYIIINTIVVNNNYWTFTLSLNMCHPGQFYQPKDIPLAGAHPKPGPNGDGSFSSLSPPALEILDCISWVSPYPFNSKKYNMCVKFLETRFGLWLIFMNGFCSSGQLLEAAEHYEAFHQLTQGRVWKDETGRFLNLLACESLLRTYRLLSDKMLENKEYKQAISILIKASEIAKEGRWKETLSRCFL